MKLDDIDLENVVTKKDKEKSEQQTINLGYILMAAFIAPLFVTVPAWYVTIEFVFGILLLVLSALILVTQTIAVLGLNRVRLAKVAMTYSTERAFSGATIFSLICAAVLATSMFMQGMTTIFVLYLIFVVVNNTLRFIRIGMRNSIARTALFEEMNAIGQGRDEKG